MKNYGKLPIQSSLGLRKAPKMAIRGRYTSSARLSRQGYG